MSAGKMRNSSITDFFKLIKKEPALHNEPSETNISYECHDKIKSEPQLSYIKEETDIPFDEADNTDPDSDDDSPSTACTSSECRSLSIRVERLSYPVVHQTNENEKPTVKTTVKTAVLTSLNGNIENCNPNSLKKPLRRKSKKDLYGADGDQFCASVCSNCNKKRRAKHTIVECEDCKTRLRYECLKCQKQTQTLQGLFSHIKRECIDKGLYYQCFKCDFKHFLKCYVVSHLKKVHPKSLFYDRIKTFEFKDPAEVHGAVDECLKCGKKFGVLINLMKHVQLCKGSKNESDSKKKGGDIAEKAPKRLSSDYTDTKDMMVRYCSKCDEEVSLNIAGPTQNKTCIKCKTVLSFKCLECKKLYAACQGTVTHILNNHLKKPKYCCSKCDFKTVSLAYVTSHYRRMHNPAVFECERCKKKWKSRENLKKHMLKCGVEPTFQCEKCSYKSCKRQYLQQHIANIHSPKVNTVVCTQCEGVFKNEKLLKTHLTYCGKEPYLQCDYCEFKTKYKAALIPHIIRHMDTTIRECPKCDQTFKLDRFYKDHLNRCKVERKVHCSICSFKTTKKKFLKIHVATEHPNTKVEKFFRKKLS